MREREGEREKERHFFENIRMGNEDWNVDTLRETDRKRLLMLLSSLLSVCLSLRENEIEKEREKESEGRRKEH